MIRTQLTLFIPAPENSAIEQCRQQFNPEQYQLINSHITLCREDEIEPIQLLRQNLEQLHFNSFTIDFGKPIRFSNEKGVLIPALGDCAPFQQLRETILKGLVEHPRKHAPHITLMHPRNSTCTDAIFQQLEQYQFPSTIRFTTVSLIEQELGKKWRVLQEYKLLVAE